MKRDELPAVVTVGGTEFTHALARLWAELESGAVVRVVSKHNSRHRGWLVPERPGGCDPVRISVNELLKNAGRIFDDVRDGIVFEVYDHVRHRARGYLMWSGPECLAALGWDVVVPYTTRTRTGRVVQREMYPIAVQAEPPAPRRGVLAGA